MDINKRIMNPMRVELLKVIKTLGESNENSIAVGNIYSRKTISLAIQRFSELELINFTDGGYFVISQKGIDFLNN